MNIGQIARRGYVTKRTSIEPLPRLSKALGGKVQILIKRDDLLPGVGGGSKTRKLDFELQAAVDQGADSIVTWGALQSNHCRLSLDWANREGLACHLVLEERIPGTYQRHASSNNFLYHVLGVASITVVPHDTDMPKAAADRANQLRDHGKKPYIIDIGASTALGTLGYAACAMEIESQLFETGQSIDHVVVASGSGGSQAGLITGFAGMSRDIRVHGIAVGRPRGVQEEMVRGLVHDCAALLVTAPKASSDAVVCYDDYIGAGYSLPTDGMIEAVTLLARTEGILLDPVYTGKAMAGLLDLVRCRTIPEGSTTLFIHTGGSLALFEKTENFWNYIDPTNG